MENIKEINSQYPLVLVFYLEREFLSTPEVIQPFVDSVNREIESKGWNVMGLFLPCAEGESESIKCINPVQIKDIDMVKINKLMDDIKTQFDIEKGADIGINDKSNEIELKSTEENN